MFVGYRCGSWVKELRKALYLPVVATTRCNPAMKAFYQRLLARGKQKKVALIACMNKLIHIIWAILKSRELFAPGRVPPVPETQPA